MPKAPHSDNPYLPLELPEFGVSVSWAMCRNTMCPNFGVHFAGPASPGETRIADERYTINTETGDFKCGYCSRGFTLKSNLAIRKMARYFLSLSLPFATCPKGDCENFGYNVFEHHPYLRKVRGRRYAPYGTQRMQCKRCEDKVRTFYLGEALRIHKIRGVEDQARAVKKRLRDIIRGAMYYRSISMIVEDIEVSENTYYGQLKSAGARLRDYLAWRNAHLLRDEFAKTDEPVRVYTDTQVISFTRYGKGPRFTKLHVPVSVIDLPNDRTYYILAAHPGFLPKHLCPRGLPELSKEIEGREDHTSPWDCARHPLALDPSLSTADQMKALPDTGRGGWFLVSPYLELAHFLTVRKMLSRFPKVYHYMDAHPQQSAAAVTALAQDIRSGRCEIALYQDRDKPEEGVSRERWSGDTEKRQAWLKSKLDTAWQVRESQWPALSEDTKPSEADQARFRADRFGLARKGANDAGGWAWLNYPPPGPRFAGGQTLWLTQRPGVTYEAVGREVLWAANTLPVDRAHSHLRDDGRAFQRASFRAEPGRSYRDSPRDPFALMAELWIAILWRNFGPRHHLEYALKEGEEPRPPPAWSMGVGGPRKPRRPDLATLAWKFRLDLPHAVRMSKWLQK